MGRKRKRQHPLPAEKNEKAVKEEKRQQKKTIPISKITNPVLNQQQIAQFESDGFLLLPQVFSTDTASSCRDFLWNRLEQDNINKNPSTWVERHGIPEIYYPSTHGYPWDRVITPKLTTAIDQLCGMNRWQSFGCGWFVINFPNQSTTRTWGACGKWHVDGAHYQHHLNSKQCGLVPIFLFSSIKPEAGGTALWTGSHCDVARVLFDHEPKGLHGGKELNEEVLKHMKKQEEPKIVEIQGEAGDVMLCHPFLLHARSKNLGQEGIKSVRFMCNPNVALHRPMNIPVQPEHLLNRLKKKKGWEYTPVEQAIIDALQCKVGKSSFLVHVREKKGPD